MGWLFTQHLHFYNANEIKLYKIFLTICNPGKEIDADPEMAVCEGVLQQFVTRGLCLLTKRWIGRHITAVAEFSHITAILEGAQDSKQLHHTQKNWMYELLLVMKILVFLLFIFFQYEVRKCVLYFTCKSQKHAIRIKCEYQYFTSVYNIVSELFTHIHINVK